MILLQIIHEIRKLVHIPLAAENEIYSFVIILEKHNYIAELLISLGVSEETAYEDSCKIEHDISEESFMALKKLSGILADKTNN